MYREDSILKDSLEGLMSYDAVCRDLIKVLVGKRIDGGQFREVFEYGPNPKKWVIKIATHELSSNVVEAKVWYEAQGLNSDLQIVKDWLAPVKFISPDSRVLVMRRTQPIEMKDLPKKLPSFVNWDVKPENFGMLDGRLVCHDYGCFYQWIDFDTKMSKLNGIYS